MAVGWRSDTQVARPSAWPAPAESASCPNSYRPRVLYVLCDHHILLLYRDPRVELRWLKAPYQWRGLYSLLVIFTCVLDCWRFFSFDLSLSLSHTSEDSSPGTTMIFQAFYTFKGSLSRKIAISFLVRQRQT